MNPPDRINGLQAIESERDYLVILFLLIVSIAESEGIFRVDE